MHENSHQHLFFHAVKFQNFSQMTYKKHPPKKRKGFTDFIGTAIDVSNSVIGDLTKVMRNPDWSNCSPDDSSLGKPVMLTCKFAKECH